MSSSFRMPEIKSVPEYAFDALLDEIKRFQERLTDETELGILANGGSSALHVENLKCHGQILVFDGVDSEGRVARIIQHYTQVSLQMIAVPKQQEQPRRIGF